MIYRLLEAKAPINYTDKNLRSVISKGTGLPADNIIAYSIVRRSLDARHQPKYNLTIEIETESEIDLKKHKNVRRHRESRRSTTANCVVNADMPSPIVVGAGPAGLMAALVLAEQGAKPIIYERGSDATKRAGQVQQFITNGELSVESNVLFGEGGAGLFSDGKLTARTKDRATSSYFFEALVECGAPESILIDAGPHLGSDLLLDIIPALRKKIMDKGGEFHFDSRVSDIITDTNKVSHLVINDKKVSANNCILATGHSARDIYSSLSRAKIALEEKPFAMGVRLEISQETVNKSQYREHHNMPGLEAAAFRLAEKPRHNSRAVYSFCMCPGGEVIPCASSIGMLTTNGMSLSKRDGGLANAAFVVPIDIDDFAPFREAAENGMAGCQLQESFEKLAFEAGGSDYGLPASRLSDFLDRSSQSSLPKITSCHRARPAILHNLLPDYVVNSLITTIPKMISSFGKPSYDDICVYAAETRSSSPVRIARDRQTMMSTNTEGLYPCGEGSGYAGGIVSSALDGIKAARALLQNSLS